MFQRCLHRVSGFRELIRMLKKPLHGMSTFFIVHILYYRHLYVPKSIFSAPTVSTTFVQKNGAPFLGIYWGDNDAMNTFKQHPTPGANIFHASLESVLIALRQAVFERHLSKVIVRTNSEYIVKCANIYLKNWRENGYFKRDGSPVKNKEELQDLDQLLGMIEVNPSTAAL